MVKQVKYPKKLRERLEQVRQLKEGRIETAKREIERIKERERLSENRKKIENEVLKELDGSVVWDSEELDRFEKRAQSRAAALTGFDLMGFV